MKIRPSASPHESNSDLFNQLEHSGGAGPVALIGWLIHDTNTRVNLTRFIPPTLKFVKSTGKISTTKFNNDIQYEGIQAMT